MFTLTGCAGSFDTTPAAPDCAYCDEPICVEDECGIFGGISTVDVDAERTIESFDTNCGCVTGGGAVRVTREVDTGRTAGVFIE